VKLLLDTHTVLWFYLADPQLTVAVPDGHAVGLAGVQVGLDARDVRAAGDLLRQGETIRRQTAGVEGVAQGDRPALMEVVKRARVNARPVV
jgi:hypothetical protein